MVTIEQIRAYLLSLEDVVEKPHFERTAFRTTKRIFATVMGTGLNVKLSEIDQSVFILIDGVDPVPNKSGKQGWTMFDLTLVSYDVVEDALGHGYQMGLA